MKRTLCSAASSIGLFFVFAAFGPCNRDVPLAGPAADTNDPPDAAPFNDGGVCPGDHPAHQDCEGLIFCPNASRYAVLGGHPFCQNPITCAVVESVFCDPDMGHVCPGDHNPGASVCDVYFDGFCPPGSQHTVIDCRPFCQDITTCAEVPFTSAPDMLGPADRCAASGGVVQDAQCCNATQEFPNMCGAVGACACSPQNSHTIRICDCNPELGAYIRCFDGTRCISIVDNDCIKAGGQCRKVCGDSYPVPNPGLSCGPDLSDKCCMRGT